ncbi:MAG: putative outer rane adhesin like protein [Akkermansiaceae bacterium]|nr:putative outer rane adhesin like protein [Akkermansiaceae bacterium]
MNARLLSTALFVLAVSPALQAQLLLTEINSNGSVADYWEITNVGSTAVDLGGYRWTDSEGTFDSAAAWALPQGSTIAAGESIIFTKAAESAFRTWWGNLPVSVKVFSATASPGLGMNDGAHLFDGTGATVFSFSYASGGFTQSGGAPAAGGHAGASGGGTASQALVWDPTFGTSAPRYTAATGSNFGTKASSSNPADTGSPGYSGFGGTGPSIVLTLSATPSSFSESSANPAAVATVTRTGSTDSDLVVSLSSSDTTEATVPATVTIPAHQTSVTFPVTAVDDTFPDGSKVATLTASAADATAGTTTVTVLDDGDVLASKLMLTEVLSDESSSAAGTEDYWELTNFGTDAVSLAGYSWHDSGRSAASAAAYALPAGASIAPGESVIFTVAAPADFRTWWGISNSVKIFQTLGAPGLGKGDGISFFDASGNELFFFSYAGGGFLTENGTPSTVASDHTGIAGGGATSSQALVWVPSSGTTAPRYTAATGGNYGSFQATSGADFGSPGTVAAVPSVSIGNASASEGNSGTSNVDLPVTRTDTTTAFTVRYTVTGGSAASGADYQPLASGILAFPAGGAATLPVTLTLNGDTTVEPDETIEVTLSEVIDTAGHTLIKTATGTATIVNDDPVAPVIVTPPGSSTVVSGANTTLTVAVSGTPAPTVQWYQGVTGDTSHPVGTNSSSFTTPALSATTRYWARITNSAGSVDTATITVTVGATPSSIDLSTYVRIGRYDLPEPKRTVAPPGNLLAQEASGVAYNWDTDTLFVACDGGRSVTQVTKAGALVDTMTLAAGNSPQGTDFYDTEGITYIGNGQFVMTEERDRQLVLFTYVAGSTLTRSATKTVKLGTFVDNIGTEGVSYDPQTGGYICLKEISPMGIFQTNVDFNAGTATNGSPATVNSVNLFDPALAGMADFADVFALSNLPFLNGRPQSGNLLLLSQESARIVNIDRQGNIASTLQIVADPGSPLTAANEQHEGLTMDRDGILYVVNENGGGDIDHPQLWVYAPSTTANKAPTALGFTGAVNSLPENTVTISPVKVAEIAITDDGLGTNTLALSGPDAAFFEINGTSLFIKAGTVLDFETKTSYNVTVSVDDATVGTTPDATASFTLTITDVVNETPVPALIISEVSPWGSGNSPYAADWFEVTNTGKTPVSIAGWKVDDSSASFSTALALTGITSIAPGESVIFMEASPSAAAATIASFKSTWFGSNPPANLQIGTYSGSGIGLSTGGDAVNLYNAAGALQASVSFGAAPGAAPYATFENGVGLDGTAISRLSKVDVYGAFKAAGDPTEIGSPGTTGKLFISEVAPWGSGSSPYAADWFEVTNPGPRAVDLTGWRMDDNSNAFASGLALNGVTSIAPGESVIFMETATPDELAAKSASFLTTWFGASHPAGLQIGSYSGGGAGLSTGGDAVNLFDANGTRVTGVAFGSSSTGPFKSFENRARLGSDTLPLPVLPNLSSVGSGGAFAAAGDSAEIGSPGTTGKILVPEVSPWSSGNSPVAADWFEVTNTGTTAVDLTGWKMDDNSESPVAAVPLTGISSIAPGESVIYLETATPASTIPLFLSTWFGANPPAGLQVGSYTGSGVGLSTGGDAVNLYDSTGSRRANVSFGASSGTAPYATFENAAGSNAGAITALSVPAVDGAFVAKSDANEIGSPGAIANRGPLSYAQWLDVQGLPTGDLDSDHDGISNLTEFAFGLNPRGSDAGANNTNVPGGVLLARGTPAVYSQSTSNGQDFRAVFIRRKDAAAAGLTYTVQFSADLTTWESSTAIPTVVAGDGDVEAVTVPYPFFVHGKKAQYFRVVVTAP